MPLSIGKVRVDVSLCGSVPRSWSFKCMVSDKTSMPVLPPTTPAPFRPRQLSSVTSPCLNTVRERVADFPLLPFGVNGNEVSTQQDNRSKSGPTAIISSESLFSSTDSFDTAPISDMPATRRDALHMPPLEPPQWAVPARVGARLEPVCEALVSHTMIDLASKACFRVGRSPGSDVQLHHNTSSRRHALLFHHPNGGCYVVDCGSSHGTYVNGVRVRSTPSGTMIIPHRVKRGSLIRFGGPGAPSFVLKSFSIGFSSMVKDLDEPIESSVEDHSKHDAEVSLVYTHQPHEGGILKKRSFDEGFAPEAKRQRCVSPASFMLENGPIRLVSPDSPRKSKRVSFHEEPEAIYPVLLTPDVLSSDEEDSKP